MFITLEGIEGSGKTSQIETIRAFVSARGLTCIATREPGGTPIGARIRQILLDPAHVALNPKAELMLYVADRVQHLHTVIYPHLAAGDVVLCDRFFDATMVYQGYARGLDLEVIRTLHHLACDNVQPDLTLLLDLAPEQGLARAWDRIRRNGHSAPDTRFEHETISFHHRVRMGYLDLARQAPHRFSVIDAAQDRRGVALQIETVLGHFFSTKNRKK